MTPPDPRRPLTTVAALLLVSAIVLAACASNKRSSTVTTGPATTFAVGTTVAFDKSIQQDLAEVGCYPGAVDGILGPASDAAILAFQGGAGLGTDGQLGPQTNAALTKAAGARTTVCSGSTTANATTTIAGAMWTNLSEQPCGTASSGISPAVLALGCAP